MVRWKDQECNGWVIKGIHWRWWSVFVDCGHPVTHLMELLLPFLRSPSPDSFHHSWPKRRLWPNHCSLGAEGSRVCVSLFAICNEYPIAMGKAFLSISTVVHKHSRRDLVARDLCPRCNKKTTRPHRNEMINVHKTLLYHSFALAFYITNLINYTQTVITVIEEEDVQWSLVFCPVAKFYSHSVTITTNRSAI